MSIFIGHSRPTGVTWTIAGTGALILSPTSQLDDGRPDSLTAFSWLTGAQGLGSVFRLRGDWASGAIVPGLVGLSNILLPVGTKITASFRRSTDAVGNYPYTPPGFNLTQRIFQGPRGERTAWIMLNTGATPVVGVEFQISNDVNGAPTIAAAAPFWCGEAVICATTEVDVELEWSPGPVDSTVAGVSWNKQPFPQPGTVYRTFTAKLSDDSQSNYFGDPNIAGALDYESLFAKLDRGKTAVYIPRVLDELGAFSAHALHRTAMLGILTALPKPTHLNGPYFSSSAFSVLEAPIPT